MHVMVVKFLLNEAEGRLGAVARKGLLNWRTLFMIMIYDFEKVLETKSNLKESALVN